MFIIHGTRSSKLSQRPIQSQCLCLYCGVKNSFVATTYGRYIHVFWIPFFPLPKNTVLECQHCKKTYHERDIPEELKESLRKNNEYFPVKRPLWHSCGCFILIAFIFMMMFIFTCTKYEDAEQPADNREKMLADDLVYTTATPVFEDDSISCHLKECMSGTVKFINVNKLRLFSKTNGTKLLVLLKVSDIKDVNKTVRKELIYKVEECLETIPLDDIREYYIGVQGNWNMLMVKTPYLSDMDGSFADKSSLYPFYDKTINSMETNTDTIRIKPKSKQHKRQAIQSEDSFVHLQAIEM